MKSNLTDRIIMKNMVFFSHVGVLPEEKEHGQNFEIDVQFFCRSLPATRSDLLSQTINYADAFQIVRSITEQARYDLIERLAGAVADALLAAFRLAEAVEVTVRKPGAPVDGVFDWMGVAIYRDRS